MNPQPYHSRPAWWASRLNQRFVKLWRIVRNYELRQQGIIQIESEGAETVRELIDEGYGVLIASNHSFHYDSYALIEAGLRENWVAHFMTAWQVFGMTGRFGKWLLQRHGCFSINREGNDTRSFRYAVSLLQESPHPLVVFPEGDIYHSNDRIMPFRDGVGAIALAASKRSKRPIVVVPCAMKAKYVRDPTSELTAVMSRLETHLGWQANSEVDLVKRIYRFGSGFLDLKEVEHFGRSQSGELPTRIRTLAESILTSIRDRYQIAERGKDLPDRIKHVRGHLIRQIEGLDLELESEDIERSLQLQRAMEEVFFVTQLSSYHGDYTVEHPTIERIAETIDKFEEDVFELQCPTPRGQRKVVVRFGDSISVHPAMGTSVEVTTQIERAVQSILNQ